ncbi:MAG: glucose-6-phosphate dehydrogenase, partial [Ignavibacteriales bacterium]
MKKPGNHILIIFGASGDLTYRKLIPSIYDLYIQDLLPDKFIVLGASRTNLTDDSFRKKIEEGIKKFANYKNGDLLNLPKFLSCLYYISLNTEDAGEYPKLDLRIKELNKELNIGENCIYYLSTPPSLYPVIPQALGAAGLSRSTVNGWKKLIV